MSNAYFNSDAEQAEHLPYAAGKGVKRVSIYNDGNQANVATEETAQSIAGFNIPKHDEVVITYVPSGNGTGEIETVVYKLVTVVQATLTLSYDANNKLSGVVKS